MNTELNELIIDIVNDINKTGILDRESYIKLLEYGLYDCISGLQNRFAFERRLKELKANKSMNIGIIFADTNALKYTNDTFGHKAGDKLIRQCAFLLMSHFGRENCFRVSGDEFVVIVENCSLFHYINEITMFQDLLGNKHVPILSAGFSYAPNHFSLNHAIDVAEQNMHIDKYTFYKKFPEYKRQW